MLAPSADWSRSAAGAATAGQLLAVAVLVQRLLKPKAAESAEAPRLLTDKQRNLWSVLLVALVAVYGVPFFRQAGSMLPVKVVVGSMVGGMIGWRRTGLAIAFRLRVTTAAASTAVAVFGICHGSAHGLEYASQEGKVGYVLGILVTTAGLHVAGAVGALLVTDWRHGGRALRVAGASATAVGLWLVTATLSA
ncbi:HupE/UreJ family protein [Streptomyces sp. NPDC059828]|uniref:HupE/UreJ family protein n=1 Tax=Streptomyces sp. NPDC059828 TaxID=3346965 RepID=UPI00366A15E7